MEDGEVARDEETGDIKYKNIEEQHNRRNYRQADNINYLDGDYASNIYDYDNHKAIDQWIADEDEEEETTEDEESVDMNDQDAISNLMYRRNTESKADVTSLINNKVRVVKGGSWTDRPYWMQAGTRRFYDQDKSTAWIGFRCAMNRVGASVQE